MANELENLRKQVEQAKGNVEAMINAQIAVGEEIVFSGIDKVKEYISTEDFYRDIGRMTAELEIEMLEFPTQELYDKIVALKHDANWDSQYQHIGRFIEEGRQEVVKEHPEARMIPHGPVVHAPFNPLVMNRHEVDLIIANKQARGELPRNDAPVVYKSLDQAAQEYAQTTRDILNNMAPNMVPPTSDFHVPLTSPSVEKRAILMAAFRDNPEMMARFDAVDKEIYENPEMKERVAQQASSSSGYAIQECMREFAHKHQIDIPIREWEARADIAKMEELQKFVSNNNHDTYAMAWVAPEVVKLMNEMGIDKMEPHFKLSEYWETVGKQIAYLEMEKGSNPLYFADDMTLAHLRTAMYRENHGEYISSHINAAREEVLRANPQEWCDFVLAEIQQAKENNTYPEYPLTEVIKLMENVPLETIQNHFRDNPDFNLEEYFQECGRAAQHEFVDDFFVDALRNAEKKEGIGEFILQNTDTASRTIDKNQDIDEHMR